MDHKEVSLQLENSYDAFLNKKAEDFCTPPFVIQYFDEDFGEWCNIDRNYRPTHKEKLQVVQIQAQSNSLQSSDCGSESGSVNGFAGENKSSTSLACGSSEVCMQSILSHFIVFII